MNDVNTNAHDPSTNKIIFSVYKALITIAREDRIAIE